MIDISNTPFAMTGEPQQPAANCQLLTANC